MIKLDPKHATFNLFSDPFCQEIWQKRYKASSDDHILQTFRRVAKAIAQAEDVNNQDAWEQKFYELMEAGLFMPAGRILASAGLNTKATLQNCYVSRIIDDSIEGIHQAYGEAMITLSRFGGIGMDFSTLRPKGAPVGNQGLTSPGPIHWMHMWHDGAERVKQAGHRRGAMMGVMRCDHPDIRDFIQAKQTKGALTNFNVSVLITDKFMDAVKDNGSWDLVHGGKFYGQVQAKELWDDILQSTYKYSEPGVIFVDRINSENNLYYCEEITCTNPCGEQPLPPFGACNLGHINLARLVNNPFTPYATVDFELLTKTVYTAVRFLDNVIDMSNFPLEEQRQEQEDKRRVGLGVSGLHDMLIQLGWHYGSPGAIKIVNAVMGTIAHEAYLISIILGQEKGSFPLFRNEYGKGGFASKLGYLKSGVSNPPAMRNSLLLTIAPTGTVSTVFGNISSGIEPVFAWRMKRKVWIDNDKFEEHVNESFISRFYRHCCPDGGWNNVESLRQCQETTATELSVSAHVEMQACVQYWIDASVTKTVNCPPGISYEDFKHVYETAYSRGCKGCTTYVPSDIRGSVIESADAKPAEEHLGLQKDVNTEEAGTTTEPSHRTTAAKRPDVLGGHTYKLKWPHHEDNIYLTINESEGRPYEVFIASMDLRNIEWMVLSCIMLSRCLRRGEDPLELARMFQKIQGASEGAWLGPKYYTSLPAYIGKVLEDHFTKNEEPVGQKMSDAAPERGETQAILPTCPKCRGGALLKQEGCEKCTNCDYSKCG